MEHFMAETTARCAADLVGVMGLEPKRPRR